MPELQKVYMDKNEVATFKCPVCEKTKKVNVTQYKNINTAVTVKCKCPCGNLYKVLLERRKHFRKNLNLMGNYSTADESDKGRMIVTDLSRAGLKIKLNVERNFNIGDILIIVFTLDDPSNSQIKREVVVRSVTGPNVGVEFCSQDHYDALGPYLLFRLD